MGNVVMITYAALSHVISVVFDRCLDMFDITRFSKEFSAAAMWLPYIPHNLTNVKLWFYYAKNNILEKLEEIMSKEQGY